MKYFQYTVILICAIQMRTGGTSDKLAFEEVQSLSASEQNTVNKLRARVQAFLPHDYMKQDLYLARFLRAKDFRLGDAERLLRESVEWRGRHNIDNIDNVDFSDFLRDFAVYFDGVDRQGRVIMESHFGEWPMRAAVVAGKLPRLNKYGVRSIEVATRKVRELQASGKNVTQWVMLLNMEGFSVANNACPGCLPYYLNYVNSYEKYYPFTVGHVVMVNTPESFEVVLKLIRPIMNAQTKRVMKVFGADERKWRPYVDKYFARDQISDWFGGTKIRGATNNI